MKTGVSFAGLFLALLLLQTPKALAGNSSELLVGSAADAYIYGYPLVLMDITKKVLTAVDKPEGLKAPLNQFAHVRAFPTPQNKEVVSPNADTLYSSAWLDLTKEPLVLSIPLMKDRYFLLPILDNWTNVIASPGSRTTGGQAQNFLLTGPHWVGKIPSGLTEIKSPTYVNWIIGRILTNGPDDFAEVNALQDQLKLIPLSQWGQKTSPNVPLVREPAVDVTTPPVEQVANMNAAEFYKALAELLQVNPPLSADSEVLKKIQGMGLVPGVPFDLTAEDPAAIQAIEQGFLKARDNLQAAVHDIPDSKTVKGWALSYGLGSYGDNYVKRAVVALVGLGANLTADAFYPMSRVDSMGRPYDGTKRYRLHYSKEELPPVSGFWSLTMYNNEQFFVENPLNRYAIGNRSPLQYGKDGSLDLYIQHESPGADLESNWLPAPADGFNLIMRLYWPKEAVLNGTWLPPSVDRIDDASQAGAK